jgi:phosphoglycolate phosphatase-like HAD superfamily hydrolase
MLMSLQAVFFDIDGTLVDSNELHVEAWQRAFQELRFPVESSAIRRQIGKGADMLIPALVPDIDEDRREALSKRHGEIFAADYLAQVRPFGRATGLVERLHDRGVKVLLASSAKQSEVDHYVKLLRVQQVLYGTISADEVEASKPAHDIFARALAKVAPIAPSETIAVGDTPYDAIAASKVNVQTIAVRSGGFSDSDLRDAGAIALYDSIADLYEHLQDSALASNC